jgi:hypothetical protein
VGERPVGARILGQCCDFKKAGSDSISIPREAPGSGSELSKRSLEYVHLTRCKNLHNRCLATELVGTFTRQASRSMVKSSIIPLRSVLSEAVCRASRSGKIPIGESILAEAIIKEPRRTENCATFGVEPFRTASAAAVSFESKSFSVI